MIGTGKKIPYTSMDSQSDRFWLRFQAILVALSFDMTLLELMTSFS
jgi:hypothetical protein